MKIQNLFSTYILILLTIATLSVNAKDIKQPNITILNGIKIELNGNTLVLLNKYDNDEYVEITDSYNLYVNGEQIEMTHGQRSLVRDYYNQFFDITEYAEQIGKEGARLGVAGAKVGVKAAAGAIKLIFSDYESDEFEQEIEREKEHLEELAEELEEKVDEIESMTEEFEEIHRELKHDIPELDDLNWF